MRPKNNRLPKKQTTLYVRMSEKLKESLANIAQKQDPMTTISYIVNKVLTDFVAKEGRNNEEEEKSGNDQEANQRSV